MEKHTPLKVSRAFQNNGPDYFVVSSGKWQAPVFATTDIEANACLIAAAPEMLEALLSVRNEYRLYVLNDPENLEDAKGSRILAQIDHAIAKAEGK